MLTPALCGAFFFAFCVLKKPSPVGEGGSRRLTDEESFLFIVNTSSTAIAVPLPPLGKAIQFYRLFCTASHKCFFVFSVILMIMKYKNIIPAVPQIAPKVSIATSEI